METKKAMQFSVTIATTAGYRHNNEKELTLGEFALFWSKAMDQERKSTGRTVSAVISESCVVYPTEFGCPIGGERSFTATGVKHPHEIVAEHLWGASVYRVAREVAKALGQETVMVTFTDASSAYTKVKSG